MYPMVDEVIEVDTNRIRTPTGLLHPRTWFAYVLAAKRLRQSEFDLCLSLSGPMASLWAFMARPKRSVGYADEAYPFLLTDAVPGGRYRQRQHEVEYVLRLACEAGGVRTHEGLACPPITENARARIAAELAEHGIRRDDKVLVVHAGSVNGWAKRWPAAYWARFVGDVASRTTVRVVLAGGASDISIGREVRQAMPAQVTSLVGKTSVEQLVALLDRADVVASGDSGPLHLAVALGKPLVAVYGPTDVAVHGPYRPGGPVRLHRYDLPCSPCYTTAATADCPTCHAICMRLLSVPAVVDSAVELLG